MTARRTCPFCDWYLDDAVPTIETDGRGLPRQTAEALYRMHAARVDAALQAHIDTHVEEMSEG